MSRSSRHEGLLLSSPGYRRFVDAKREADPDLDLVEAFADWLTSGYEGLFDGWSEDQFRAQWERWNG